MKTREDWQALLVARAEAERLRRDAKLAAVRVFGPKSQSRAKAMHEEALRAVDLAIEGVCE